MKHIKVWTDEEKLYINENYRYEPDTGLIYWKKPTQKGGTKRKLDKPFRNYSSNGYLQIPMNFNKNEFLYFMLFRLTGGGMPFSVQNILPVIFNMKVKNYFFSTLLGITPGVFILTSIGAGLGNYVDKNNSIVWSELFKEPEIYFPIIIFIVLLVITAVINKFFFSNKFSK